MGWEWDILVTEGGGWWDVGSVLWAKGRPGNLTSILLPMRTVWDGDGSELGYRTGSLGGRGKCLMVMVQAGLPSAVQHCRRLWAARPGHQKQEMGDYKVKFNIFLLGDIEYPKD